MILVERWLGSNVSTCDGPPFMNSELPAWLAVQNASPEANELLAGRLQVATLRQHPSQPQCAARARTGQHRAG